MTETLHCALCREDIEGEPTIWQGKAYCSQTCAFEASKRLGSICGGRETTEISQRFSSKTRTEKP
ncbi:MAG: hypothetical protein HY676_06020 [Chloroflexi bacterium]|nr:hypothetical protein [Chloroflexota bacterium]